MELRPLKPNDYWRGFFPLLQQLTHAPAPPFATFVQSLKQQEAQGKTTLVLVEDHCRIVATVSVLLERKMIHGCRSVMHLEDLVVDREHRGKGLATQLVDVAIRMARDADCYKLILNCTDELVPFYRARGMEEKGKQMALYYK